MKLTPIKYQEGWLYVDKSVDKHNGLFYVNGGIGLSVGVHEGKMPKNDYCFKIVAQRNLSLPNIPYIEEVEEDEDDKIWNSIPSINKGDGIEQMYFGDGYYVGYKAAQSKGGYSEADIRKAFNVGFKTAKGVENPYTVERNFIQSLNQPKEIEVEMDYDPIYGKRGAWTFGDYELTTKVPVTYQKDGKTFLKVKQ